MGHALQHLLINMTASEAGFSACSLLTSKLIQQYIFSTNHSLCYACIIFWLRKTCHSFPSAYPIILKTLPWLPRPPIMGPIALSQQFAEFLLHIQTAWTVVRQLSNGRCASSASPWWKHPAQISPLTFYHELQQLRTHFSTKLFYSSIIKWPLSVSNLSSLSAPHQDYWWEHSESRHSVQGSTDAIAKCTLPSKLTVWFEKESLELPSHAQKRFTNSLPTQAETRNNNKRFRLSSVFSLSLGSTIKLCLPQWFLQPLKVKDKSYPGY